MCSGDAEHFLELNDEFPVVLREILLEVLLERVDGVPVEYGRDLVGLIEVSADGDGGVAGDFDSDAAVRGFRDLQGLAVELDGLDLADSLVALVRHAQGSAHLQLAGLHIHSHDDRVLHVEHIALDYLQQAWEHSLSTVLSLSLLSALFDMSLKLIEQVIDNVGSEDGDAVLISELLCVGHDLDIECENGGKLFLHMITLE